MKQRCGKNRRSIAAWLDLAEPERARLRRHTTDCAACREELEAMLAVLESLEANREAYAGLRYSGSRPNWRAQKTLTPARGIRALPSRPWWQPLPMALAGGLVAASLALYLLAPYLLNAGIRPGPPPEPAPVEPIAATEGATGETGETGSTGETATPGERPRLGPPRLRPSAAAASLAAIRREASRLKRPQAPQRPAGFGLRLPSRPTPPRPAAGKQD